MPEREDACPFTWRLCVVNGTPVESWSCTVTGEHERHEVHDPDKGLLFWWLGAGHCDVKWGQASRFGDASRL